MSSSPTPPARAWTAEPWHVSACGDLCAADGYPLIRPTSDGEGILTDDGDLERAAACVNALSGVQDPTAVRRLVSAARAMVDTTNLDAIMWRMGDLRAALAEFPEEQDD